MAGHRNTKKAKNTAGAETSASAIEGVQRTMVRDNLHMGYYMEDMELHHLMPRARQKVLDGLSQTKRNARKLRRGR